MEKTQILAWNWAWQMFYHFDYLWKFVTLLGGQMLRRWHRRAKLSERRARKSNHWLLKNVEYDRFGAFYQLSTTLSCFWRTYWTKRSLRLPQHKKFHSFGLDLSFYECVPLSRSVWGSIQTRRPGSTGHYRIFPKKSSRDQLHQWFCI